MAGQTIRKLMAATINGQPLLSEIDEFGPPAISKVMEEARGGQFIAGEVFVGIEKMSWTMKVNGATTDMLTAYGLEQNEICQVDVKTSEQDRDGNTIAIHYSLSGEIVKVDEESVKMGSKPGVTITGSPFAYKKTQNGAVLYDINVKTQVIDLGKGDVMSEHRRNAGLS